EGLPVEEVLKLCDVHSQALKGVVTETKMSTVPPGHPVHTFIQENRALQLEIAQLESLFRKTKELNATELLNSFKVHFNRLSDVDKHYRRKENLVFPYLEKLGITGPPVVMWGKHDEVRDLLKAAHEALNAPGEITLSDIESMIEFILKPATAALEEMIYKEEQILFPMCLERFTDGDWQQIDRDSLEIGFCLYDPQVKWHPEGVVEPVEEKLVGERIQLPSGSMTVE
ncbi:MAG: hemerythrin domain-containing protein, partial [candidate division KSB1 bacterium]|nr:hemerythrin domain-containing protein [candidate division KSB1 bacterium]